MSISSTGSELAARRPRAAASARAASRSLRLRLALGFGLLAVLMTAGLTLVIGELATSVARKEIGRYLTRLSIELRDKLDTGMSERMSEVEMLARLDSNIDHVRYPALRRSMIDELKRAAPDYAWLGYTDAEGRVQVALQGLLEGVDVSTRAWFGQGLKGPFAGDVRDAKLLANLLPRSGNEPPRLVDIAFPLRERDRTVGVVAAQINWSWAARLRDSIEGYARKNEPFELLVVSSAGVVLVGPSALMGEKLELNELDPERLKARDASVERWPDGLAYLTGTSATRGFGNYKGLGWVVIARQRTEHAFAPVRLLRQRIALAGGLFALMAVLLGWLIASRVSGPLRAISTAADAISRGSRRVQIPVGTGYAEVEQLSASLRAMLRGLSANEENLRQAQDQLETRVRARTAELAKARAEMELESAERDMAREEAASAKDQLALAMDASRLVLWDYDIASDKVQLSEAWSVLLGGEPVRTTESMASLTGLVPEEDRPAVRAAISAALKGPESSYRVEHRVRTASGTPIWIVSEGRVVERGPDGRALRMVGTNRDITERMRATQALRESEERFRGAMDYSPVGMALGTLDAQVVKANPALCQITGYSEEELKQLGFRNITHPDDRALVPEKLKDLLAGKAESYQVEKRYLHKAGHLVWVLVSVSVMRNALGEPQFLIAQILDISERHRLQEEVRHLALHDALTGLPNARLLDDRVERALAAAKRAGQPIALMYIDLDGFKPVNDLHGHAAGDLVLKEFAARLKQVLREIDTVARVGGDEFVAVLARIAGEDDARSAATRVLAAVAKPFDIGGGGPVSLSASIGIALFPLHGEDPATLKKHADAAMYEAKRAGKNAYRFFAGEQK